MPLPLPCRRWPSTVWPRRSRSNYRTAARDWSLIAGVRGRFRPNSRAISCRAFAPPPRTARSFSPIPIPRTSLPTVGSAKASRMSQSSEARTMTSSRLEASHDGYVRAFGLVHKRSLMLGNDGKEIRGADQLLAKGRKKIRESAAYAARFPPSLRRSRRRSPPTGWVQSYAPKARRHGTFAAVAATSRSRKAFGSMAADNPAARCSLSSSAKFRHWAAKSAGSSGGPANQEDKQ